jgi:hypothetical protein
METKIKRQLTPNEIQIIQRCEGSLRAVARTLGVGKSTVDYHRQKVYDAWAAAEPDAPDEWDTIEFERLQEPRRCGIHGLVHVWPCVICSSQGG